MIVRVGHDDVDMSAIPRLKFSEYRVLKKKYRLDVTRTRGIDEDELEEKLVLFFLRKLRPATSQQEIEALPLDTVNELAAHIWASRATWAPLTFGKGKRKWT